MRCLAALTVTLFTFVISPASGATQIPVHKYNGPTTGKYIVHMKDGADKTSLQSLIIQAVNGQVITHDWDIINGFAGPFNPAALDIIRGSSLVDSVSEDGIMKALDIQTDAPWGLRRISNPRPILAGSDPSKLSYNYTYAKSGSGADIYIVDTGIRTTHTTFTGRARWGATFGGYPNADGNGHGTHVAGTAAGFQYGVAKSANIIAVKVLSDQGAGSTADIISGLEWVQKQASSSSRASVVNMSLGGFLSPPLDKAVTSLVDGGVHVAVAAGNSGFVSNLFSPAGASCVISVAATNINDTRPSWSNWGPAVTIFAPGQDIISSWSTSDTATNQISGTSMATPHVAGLIAVFTSTFGNESPAHMKERLQRFALLGNVMNDPPLTSNFLAQLPPLS